MTKENLKNYYIPKLKAKEFKYIRKHAGVTQEQFAYFMDKRSKGTVNNWESQVFMLPYQVAGLVRMIGKDLFDACKRDWDDWQAKIKRDTENHIKYLESKDQQKVE